MHDPTRKSDGNGLEIAVGEVDSWNRTIKAAENFPLVHFVGSAPSRLEVRDERKSKRVSGKQNRISKVLNMFHRLNTRDKASTLPGPRVQSFEARSNTRGVSEDDRPSLRQRWVERG